MEAGLWVWELNKSQTKSVEPSSQRLILALGDSVSQMGYAQILENTRGGDYRVQNLALAGSGMSTVLEIFEKNSQTLSRNSHDVVVMTGHNDCQYLRHFAEVYTADGDETWSFELQRFLWKLRTVRFMQILWAETTKSKQAPKNSINNSRHTERCLSTLRDGYSHLALQAQRAHLNLHFMTYPVPHTVADDNWTELMWVSVFINQQIRHSAAQLDVPLIDAEKCMADLPVEHWKSDKLHLARAGALAQMKCIFNHLGIEP